METTQFLAEIWGPILIAVAVGMLISREYYLKVYRDLDKETLAGLIIGLFGMAAGIAQIHFHNSWGTFPEIVISALGWGLLLKSAAFAISPRFVEKSASWYSKGGSGLTVAAVACLLLGAYLTWFAFFFNM